MSHRLNIQLTTKRIAWDDQSMSPGAPLMSSLTSTWSPRVTDCLRRSIGRTTSISGFRAGHDSDMNSSGRLSRLNNNDSVTVSVPIIHDSLQPCEIFHDYETNNKSTILQSTLCIYQAIIAFWLCKSSTPAKQQRHNRLVNILQYRFHCWTIFEIESRWSKSNGSDHNQLSASRGWLKER